MGRFFSLQRNITLTYHDETWGDAFNKYIVIDNLYVMTFTGDVKFHIPTCAVVEPYSQAGIGFTFIGVKYPSSYHYNHVFAECMILNLWGGLDFWDRPWYTVGGRIFYRGMRFGELKSTASGVPAWTTFTNALSFDLTIAYHF